MSLSLKQTIKISRKKLLRKKLRLFFIVFPVAFMTMVIFVVTTLLGNIETVFTQQLIDKLDERLEIVAVDEFQAQAANVTLDDVQERAQFIPNVSGAYQVRSVDYLQARSDDIEQDRSAALDFHLLPPEATAIYTSEDFMFERGKPIPLVLNRASTFVTDQNWDEYDNQDTVEFDYSQSDPFANAEVVLPVETRVIETPTDELLGKVVSMTIGGLAPHDDYEITTSAGAFDLRETYTRLSEAELALTEKQRRQEIAPYWDYDALAAGVTYEFVIVAVDDSITSIGKSYIPLEAGLAISQELHDIEVSARTATPPPAGSIDTSGTTFSGVVLENDELISYGSINRDPFDFSQPIEGSLTSYVIPGLIFEDSADGPQPLILQITQDKLSPIQTLVVMTDSQYRGQVIEDLNELGLFAADESLGSIFGSVSRFFYIALAVMTGVMFGINLIIIVLTLGRSVAESRREIGVWRAIGASQNDVLRLFLSQAALVTIGGFIAGTVVGWVVVFLIAGPLSGGIDSFFEELVGVFISEPISVSRADFLMPDISVFGAYLLVLFAIVIAFSLIPSRRAAAISPVEAIRKAD